MTPLRRDTLHGIWATALLPLTDDEDIDFGRLGDDLDRLVAARPHGIYVNGSAGEFVTLSEDEFGHIAALVADKCSAGGVAYQIGASHPSGQVAYDRIRRSLDFAPSARAGHPTRLAAAVRP